jgi:RimJ/RimL family protein N-acetyltransferase
MSATSNRKELPPLFCKPVSVNYSGQLLYVSHDEVLDATISFRSLELDSDINFLYDWVNRPYTKRFWQLNGSKSLLYDTYRDILNNSHAHSFIGCYNSQPVSQVDLYNIAADELKDHIDYVADDCGLHLLMLPPAQMSKGLSLIMLRHFIRFYFSFPVAKRLYAEPDKENTLANRLASKAGFGFLKTIELSYKTANLYLITKNQFHETRPVA